MARYRLTAPHYVDTKARPGVYMEAGTEIDSGEMPAHWQPTPLMMPLDAAAEKAHAEVTRAAIHAHGGPAIPGIGNVRDVHEGKARLDETGWADTP
jgi:hypothetical protein